MSAGERTASWPGSPGIEPGLDKQWPGIDQMRPEIDQIRPATTTSPGKGQGVAEPATTSPDVRRIRATRCGGMTIILGRLSNAVGTRSVVVLYSCCSSSRFVPLHHQCSSGALPVEYRCSVPVQYQCSTNVGPVQDQLRTSAVPVYMVSSSLLYADYGGRPWPAGRSSSRILSVQWVLKARRWTIVRCCGSAFGRGTDVRGPIRSTGSGPPKSESAHRLNPSRESPFSGPHPAE